MNVVAFVPDLMDRSRLAAAVPGVRFVTAAEELAEIEADADVVLVDLARPGVLEVLPRLQARVIGFASRVDTELVDAARHAGCTEVLPRSAFFNVSRLRSRLGNEPETS